MVPRFESATNSASGESPLLKATYVDDDPISQSDASGECRRRIKAQFREDTFIAAAKPTLTTGGLGSKVLVRCPMWHLPNSNIYVTIIL
jgi:hypothetical protein